MSSTPQIHGDPIRLRGHHLLCVFGFRGYGYDTVFVANMSEIVKRLLLPETLVEIVAGPDVLCACCPKRDKESCRSSEHLLDGAVLTALNLSLGHVERAQTLFPAVAAKLTSRGIKSLCGECSWYDLGYCAHGIADGHVAAGWEGAVSETSVTVADEQSE